MRLLFFLIISLAGVHLFLQSRTMVRSSEKPVFLQVDELALTHQTHIDLICDSPIFCPDSLEVDILKKDYANLWAHLNHLHSTNDILAGKEYYTERWFRQLASHYTGRVDPLLSREDLHHELHLQNWSSDGLVCTAIDRNVLLKYTYPDQREITSSATLAVVLLYQGDHWRIDGLRVLEEVLFEPEILEGPDGLFQNL